MENIGYKKLLTWQVADLLAKKIYKITTSFPKSELYGTTSQLRRAALSIPLNIVEGQSRNNKKEFKQFLRIALGSLTEVEYLLDFAKEQNYINEVDFKEIILIREKCGQLLWKLLKSQF